MRRFRPRPPQMLIPLAALFTLITSPALAGKQEADVKANTPAEDAPASAAKEPSKEPPAKEKSDDPADWTFVTHQLVLLKRGPAWTAEPSPDSAEIQKAHLAHLTAMAEAGRAVVCGPFSDQDDESVRGACIYRVGSADEARKWAEMDPAVKAGRLAIDVMTWWTVEGRMSFPMAPTLVQSPAEDTGSGKEANTTNSKK